MSRLAGALLLAMAAIVPLAPAEAAVGDIHRVTGERVNLRAGPSDDANVRAQVVQGEQLVELRSEGNWYGVRVLRTGEEGWIYGDLIERVSTSTLEPGTTAVADTGFADLSRDFDRLLGSLVQRRGVPLFASVRQPGGDTLEATLTEDWLRAGSEDEHLLAAAAVYEMWKNHQNSRPVRVLLLDPAGKRYITIDDTAAPGNLVTVGPG